QALGEICKVRRVALDLALHSGIDRPPDALSIDDAMKGFLPAHCPPLGLAKYQAKKQCRRVFTAVNHARRVLPSGVMQFKLVQMKGTETRIHWSTPTLVEICIGLEINGYLPAEF